MAAVTAAQIIAARDAGHAAALALQRPEANPHVVHTPVWKMPRTAVGRAALAARQRPAAVLARAWRLGYQAGQADYARARGLAVSRD